MSDRFDEEAAELLGAKHYLDCPEHFRGWGKTRSNACQPCVERAVAARLRADEAEIARLRAGIAAVSELINNSHGVSGLHLNGDDAPWDSLLAGGRFEEWLAPFSAALDAKEGA